MSIHRPAPSHINQSAIVVTNSVNGYFAPKALLGPQSKSEPSVEAPKCSPGIPSTTPTTKTAAKSASPEKRRLKKKKRPRNPIDKGESQA